MSRKKEVIERQFRQALTEEAIKKIAKKGTRAAENGARAADGNVEGSSSEK